MAIIFDSNVWIALFNENDAHHGKAQQLFSENAVIYIPEYVILEITTVLQLRASKLKANLFAKMIAATAELDILYASDEFFQTALSVFQQQTQKLSFVDCALVVLAKNYIVYTFDEALARVITHIK